MEGGGDSSESNLITLFVRSGFDGKKYGACPLSQALQSTNSGHCQVNKFVKLNWLAEREHFRKSTSSNQTELSHTKPNSSIPN